MLRENTKIPKSYRNLWKQLFEEDTACYRDK